MYWKKLICLSELPRKKAILVYNLDRGKDDEVYISLHLIEYDIHEKYWTLNGREVSDEHILENYTNYMVINLPR